MGGRDIQAELLDQAREPRGLTLWKLEDQAGQRRGVHDGMLQRAFQAAPHEPGVECVVAVLDEHRTLREPQEGTSCVLELRSTDQHRAVDVVPPSGVGIDGGSAVDERVEKRERLLEREALSSHLQDEERRVAGRLDIQGDELGVVQTRPAADLGRVDRDLFPRDKAASSAGLEVDLARAHRASARARRAHAISSRVTARSSSTATP